MEDQVHLVLDDKNLQEGKCDNYSEKCIYNKSIKTLADIPHFKVDINGEKV